MQLALGAVGAAAGNFLIPGGFLGMSGASLGWSFGSALGGFFQEGPTIEGPRLQDKSITVSAYGNLRPILYGAYRVGGEVIWADKIKEHKHEEEQGKGAGGGATYVTYTYTVSLAVALCAGEKTAIRKLWLDSKLVYTQAEDATAKELQKSAKFAKRMKFYPGNYTQLPDPTIEAVLGAGNVPAYRGTCYVVFTNLDITKYGNRIPQITAEVVDGVGTASGTLVNSTYAGQKNNLLGLKDGVLYATSGTDSQSSTDVKLNVMRLEGDLAKARSKTVTKTSGNLLSDTTLSALGGQAPTYWGAIGITPSGKFMLVDCGRNTGTSRYIGVLMKTGFSYNWLGICQTDYDLLDNVDLTDKSNSVRVVENDDILNPLTIYIYHYPDGKLYRFDVTFYFLGGYVLSSYPTWTANVDNTRYDTNGNASYWYGLCVDSASGDVFVIINDANTSITAVKRFTSEGDFVESKFSGVITNSPSLYSCTIAFSSGLLWVAGGTIAADGIKVYDWNTEELLFTGPTSGIVDGAADSVIMEAQGNIMVMWAYGNVAVYKLVRTRDSVALDEVVSDICQQSGLDPSQFDVTDLASDSVRGMVIGRQMSGRGAIQHLGGPYFFDGVESDGILKFVKRGGSSIVTLDDDDMGCYDGEVVELWQATRTQEEELPQKLTIIYSQWEADYQQGAQYSLREAVLSGNNMSVEFSIAFTDDEAKAVVDTLMFTAWQNRHGFKIPTWQAFNYVEPTDIITAGGETIRITRKSEGVNGLVEIEGVRELPAIYTGQVGTGASGSVGGQVVPVPGPTDFELLDIQNLRDRDYNSYGFYVAAAGYLPDWDGTAVLKSADNGDNFTLLETINTASVFGQATTVLGNFYSGNIFDELNTVRVAVNGTLSSATWDEVLNGANPILIGDEILQFRTATLVSTGIYDLTGLLRGRRGTEWAMGTHIINERAVFLDENKLHFIALDATDYNTQRLYGFVTSGETIEEATTDYLTYTGENLKPFPPVHLAAAIASDDSISLSWDQRTRYHGLWLSGRAPLEDEADTEFEVVIYNDSNFTTALRTTTGITSSPWSYTVAMQTADFGYPVKTIHYKVRQVGSARNSEWASYTGTVTNVGSMLLMHFDGAQDEVSFVDVYGHSFTRSGLVRLRTDGAKFGTTGCFFPQTVGFGYIRCPYSIDLDPEYLDFTAECFVNITDYRADVVHLMGTWTKEASGSTDAGWQLGMDSTGHLVFRYGTGSSTITVATGSSTITKTAFKHVAVVRQGDTLSLYYDSNRVATATLTANLAFTKTYFWIGSTTDSSLGGTTEATTIYGYMDEARFSKGIARYSGATYTVPTAAFTS
jgi:hypothetical protein